MAAVIAMAAVSFFLIMDEDSGAADAATTSMYIDSNANANIQPGDTLIIRGATNGDMYSIDETTVSKPSWMTYSHVNGLDQIAGTAVAGNYTISYTYEYETGLPCTSSHSITVTATVKPVASFTYVLDGLKVNFSDTSTNTPTSWTWAYGDGTSATAKSPTKTYAAAGTYNVTLTATNSAGSNSHTRAVTVNATPGATACTVTYDTDGGTAITAAETTVGATLTLPAATKANKTFTGWYVGASFVGNAGSNYAVTGNATLTAHWADQTTTKYTVTFFHEGRALSSQDVVSGGKATDPGAPAGKGKFTGWATSNGTVYSFATPVTANLNLYAQFDAPSIWDNNLILYALIGLVVVLLIVAIARTIG